MTTLATPRLQLRPLDAGDEALYVHLYTDADTVARMGPPPPAARVRSAFKAALARDPRRAPVWVMVRVADGERLGLIGLEIDEAGTAQLGSVCPPVHQSQGYSKEAGVAVLDHGFGALGVRKVETRHADDHPKSVAVMRSLGFEMAPSAGPPWPCRWTLTPELWRARGDKGDRLG